MKAKGEARVAYREIPIVWHVWSHFFFLPYQHPHREEESLNLASHPIPLQPARRAEPSAPVKGPEAEDKMKEQISGRCNSLCRLAASRPAKKPRGAKEI